MNSASPVPVVVLSELLTPRCPSWGSWTWLSHNLDQSGSHQGWNRLVPAVWSEIAVSWPPRSWIRMQKFTVMIYCRCIVCHSYVNFILSHKQLILKNKSDCLCINRTTMTDWSKLGLKVKHKLQQMPSTTVTRGYLVAFSSTDRVRKLIHIPSLWPRIHSRIPDGEWTGYGQDYQNTVIVLRDPLLS